MPEKMNVALRVWAVSVVVNAVIFAIGLMITGGFFALLSIFLFLIFGFLFTAPVPFLTWFSLHVSAIIPYPVKAKLILFATLQLVIVLLFYLAALMIISPSNGLRYDDGQWLWLGLTCLSVCIAVFLTRKSVQSVLEEPSLELLA